MGRTPMQGRDAESDGEKDSSDDMSKHAVKVLTPKLLSRLQSYPGLPRDCWYVVSSVTLSALNRPAEVKGIFERAVGLDGEGMERCTSCARS